MRKIIAASLLLLGLIRPASGKSPAPVKLLWPKGAPGAVGSEPQDKPSLTIFLPPRASAVPTGVVVIPGGGYVALAMNHEGYMVAKWLNSLGIAAFVLKYRIAPRYKYPAPILDGERAVRWVRYHAAKYGIAPDRLGVWGFSAGGHLASTIGTHFDAGNPAAADPIDRESDRPDFMVLAYPVISFTTPYTHQGSMHALLGPNPSLNLRREFSNELHVTPETPPTFLFSTDDDTTVPCENVVLFFLALRKNHVPAEMHIFEPGHHGLGLAPTVANLSIWPTLLANWFRLRGLLK